VKLFLERRSKRLFFFVLKSNIFDFKTNISYNISARRKIMKNLKLKAARAKKDLSQKDLALMIGVSRQTINMIENGDYNPTLQLCIAICKALEMTLNDIFWEE